MISYQFYLGTSRYAMEQGSYNLSLPRSLYGDDINGNSHHTTDPMTQSCYVQLGGSSTSSDTIMSSSLHGGGSVMHPNNMTNSMIMTTRSSPVSHSSGRARATAWNEYSANNSEGLFIQ